MNNYIEKKKKEKGGEKNIGTAKRRKIRVFFFASIIFSMRGILSKKCRLSEIIHVKKKVPFR